MQPSKTVLPPELWVHILQWATYYPRPSEHYVPFESITFDDRAFQDVLDTRLAVVLVCKQWNAIGMELLYGDIIIRHGSCALNRTLERIPDRCRWIQSASLPYSHSTTPNNTPPPCLSILTACSGLRVLLRPPSYTQTEAEYQFSIATPTLPMLRRLEWTHNSIASRTDGINFLPDVIRNAPTLEYLTVAGIMQPNINWPSVIVLPKLRVLRMQNINPIHVRRIVGWTYPALTHLILESVRSLSIVHLLTAFIGEQIECVELGPRLYHMGRSYLPMIINSYPRLRELNYFVFFAHQPVYPAGFQHVALARIGLHAQKNAMLDDIPLWKRARNHIAAFTDRATFPALSEVRLYGNRWRVFEEREEVESLQRELAGAGIALTLDFSA